tara:strand:- start:3944 stop:4168 length:225 start_codon:yes stop_codon:yes gene_type:complete
MNKSKNETDISGIIFNAIVQSEENPLILSDSEKVELANQITEICVKFAFKKNRDKFRKEIGKVIAHYAEKYEAR